MQPPKLPLSLYVHVPFCVEACPYCNFNFRLLRQFDAAFIDRYIDAVLREYALWTDDLGDGYFVKTLYFGGGTPSVLSPEQVKRLVNGLAPRTSKMEITFETNPEHLQPERLAGWRKAGVNRLSLGVQSFDAQILKNLGRAHTSNEVIAGMQAARQAGFENISVDLIAGAPGEDLAALQSDLAAVIALQPEHVSYYGLTIEEKTVFYERRKRGELTLPDEETQARMFETVRDGLTKVGFQHYEISNFAKPGRDSEHNSGYWIFRDYLGLGAGAHSFRRKNTEFKRFLNRREPRAYVETLEAGGLAHETVESLSEQTAMGEFVFTGLRRLQGFSALLFQNVFKKSVEAVFGRELADLVKHGMLEESNEGWRLTKRGVLLSDSVFEAFV